MPYVRVFLALILAVVWMGNGAGLAAPPRAAGDSAAQADGPGQVPTGLTPSEWQTIQTQVAKLTAADGAAGDGFGVSVSLDGDTVVVGTPWADVGGHTDQGETYAFYRNKGGSDAWGQVAKLTAADGAPGDYSGYSVAVSGDTVVIGAFLAAGGQGAAYVFYRDQGGADTWGQVAKLTAADGKAGDWFGDSVAVSGDTVVVGAYMAVVGGNTQQGATYIYHRNQDGTNAWGQVAKLTAADGAAGSRFGDSVAVSGDTTVVGSGCGACPAYVYYRDQGGTDAWGQVATLTAADGAGGDFGRAVAVSGDTAVVGAVGATDGQGAAYVFDRDHGGTDTWGQVAKLTAADGRVGDNYGYSAAVSGDTAIIGAHQAAGDNGYQGAAYTYYRDQGGADAWGQVAKFTAADGAWGDWFGDSVAVSGDTAVVGAYVNGGGRGAAYVYALLPAAWGDAYTTAEDTLLQVSAVGVLANDLNPNSHPLTAVLDTGPAHGALDLHADGSFTYSSAADWNGLDTFTYHANNGKYNSDVATVTITVTPVNDAPVATNDLYLARLNAPRVVVEPGVLLNDTDVESDPLSAVLDTGPAHGTLDLDSDGAFVYTPAPNFVGVDTFTYHASDGAADSSVATVQVTITEHVIYLPLVLRPG